MKTIITMNGKGITDLTDFRANFSLEEAMELQKSGALSKWLKELYYENEAEAVMPYKFSNWNRCEKKRFCSILGVDYAECLSDSDKAAFDNNRQKLTAVTDDINILNNADVVATDQSQLAALINSGEKVIVLYNGEFSIPMSKPGITYYCVGTPKITNLCTAEQYQKLGIIVNGINLPTDENKSNEASFVAAAENNGYDFFYEKHCKLANYFHKEMQANEMSFYCPVGNISGSPTFRLKSECVSAKKAAIKKLYDKASGYLIPDRSNGLVISAAKYYEKYITPTFENIANGLLGYCKSTGKTDAFNKLQELCKNAQRNLRKLFTAEITDGDYYKMYDINYFYDHVDVEKNDYSEGFDAASRFFAKFADGWIEYRYESLYDVMNEMQNDIDGMAKTFVDNVHGEYKDYIRQIENLAEEIGGGMQIPEGKSIEEYLNGFIPKRDNTGDSGAFADLENLFCSCNTDSQVPTGNTTIFQI